jgi:DNA-binding response OmpR family regulator
MDQSPCIELIDDDPAWRETLADYLRSKGFRVVVAGTGEQGLKLLRRDRISMVVCDYNLAGEDGLGVVRRIHSSVHGVVILMVSNDDEPSLAKRALAAGAHAFLPKTISPTTLLQQIRQLSGVTSESYCWHRMLQLWQRLLPAPFSDKRRASA